MGPQIRVSAKDLVVVCEGPVAHVRLSQAAHNAYLAIQDGKSDQDVRRKTHLNRYFQEYCTRANHRLSAEKFKKEGNFPDGRGGKVAVFVFKVWQWRLYGAVMKVSSKKCFIGMRVDSDKKKDKANRSILESAAIDIANLVEYGE